MRTEQEIFDDLAELCSSSGYAHVIAHLCFRDNVIGYDEEMTSENMLQMFSTDRLIRTEVSTLIGLLIKKKIDFTLPPSSVVQEYLEKTERLLQELHSSMSGAWFSGLDPEKVAEEGFNPFASGEALREPIFYGGESAYNFQYRDLSPKKFANDDAWLVANKGFSIRTARDVVHAVEKHQNENLMTALTALRNLPMEEWTMLPGFIFTSQEIAEGSGHDSATVEGVLAAFSVPVYEKNGDFRTLSDFNIANALPLLRTDDGSFILFHVYSLVEALYESPFYWMCGDKSYADTAMQHRGRFTEEFSRERLELVFGEENVHSNVNIFESKGKMLGEIDVLVLFGNRAIVLQAKSKRLTLEAKKGNDGQIRSDFKKSVQDSYDQGYECAKLLTDARYTLRGAGSEEIEVPSGLKEVYVFCVVSDHYPALSFQARQFLKFETTESIRPPFIMDVFALDAMTEMLGSPLRLLSYASQRTAYSDKLLASHELNILGYHLKNNLWVESQNDLVAFSDDVAADLDVAMAVRRDGIPGKPTPDGILTRLSSTTLGGIIKKIEKRPDPAMVDLGFMLLTLSEDAVIDISDGIDKIMGLAKLDGKNHDLTLGFGGTGTGITVHCNTDPISLAAPRLQNHCEIRKYSEKAHSWFGVSIDPENGSLRFGVNLEYTWERNADMDVNTRNLGRPTKITEFRQLIARKKVGRNDLCPCGSGFKYKKCCLKP